MGVRRMHHRESAADGVSGAGAAEVPRFSVAYMDRTQDPRRDFYEYAVGGWLRDHPVPADKSLWGAFTELSDRNFELLRAIMEEAARTSPPGTSEAQRQVGLFFASAMDTARIEEKGLRPILPLWDRIGGTSRTGDLVHRLAELHAIGISGLFDAYSAPDKRDSGRYALYFDQGGLSLPDREYYLAPSFEEMRAAYGAHLGRMFRLGGESVEAARADADRVLAVETELARSSRSRTELRDAERNYHRKSPPELDGELPTLAVKQYLADLGAREPEYIVLGQPEFFAAADRLLRERPLNDSIAYLRWHLLHAAAPFLTAAVESEDFDFFHRVLLGQREPEPRWKRAGMVLDARIGEALGRLYVERHFPAEARRRMGLLLDDLRAVFRERLAQLDWMTEGTRRIALAKFDRFSAKIGHPDRFRDYSAIPLTPDGYLANIFESAAFETRRQLTRIGSAVDRTEWLMTPPTVNAYFSPTQNEIVFPAGILQPPFFDLEMDDAVNYGGIGGVIGHEITHGYDDQGRKYDAEGNLREWWTAEDLRKFEERARRVVDLYGALEGVPGTRVNGELTLGENIADLGGVKLAFEALERRLEREPAARRSVDGFSAEQRFFLSWAQCWRLTIREPEARRRLTIDPHAPARYRGSVPVAQHPAFRKAFPPPSGGGAPDDVGPGVGVW